MPFACEMRSFLSAIGQRAVDDSWINSGNHTWFLQSGATRRTEHLTSLTRLMTWGSRAIGGKVYRRAMGQSWARASRCLENRLGSRSCLLSTERSSSALPKTDQIIWTIWGYSFHSPGDTLSLDSRSAPWFSLPGTWTTLSERRLPCAHNRRWWANLWRECDLRLPWWLM